jgi:hypothetical protein
MRAFQDDSENASHSTATPAQCLYPTNQTQIFQHRLDGISTNHITLIISFLKQLFH